MAEPLIEAWGTLITDGSKRAHGREERGLYLEARRGKSGLTRFGRINSDSVSEDRPRRSLDVEVAVVVSGNRKHVDGYGRRFWIGAEMRMQAGGDRVGKLRKRDVLSLIARERDISGEANDTPLNLVIEIADGANNRIRP